MRLRLRRCRLLPLAYLFAVDVADVRPDCDGVCVSRVVSPDAGLLERRCGHDDGLVGALHGRIVLDGIQHGQRLPRRSIRQAELPRDRPHATGRTLHRSER